MSTKADIKLLSRLSRLSLSETEEADFDKQVARILNYVGQISQLEIITADDSSPTTGWVRTDQAAPQSSDVRNKILDQAPVRRGDFWEVASAI